MIIGIDEVGYGSWAGPLVLCAVKAKEDFSHPSLTDSKKLSATKREKIIKNMNLYSVEYKLFEISSSKIDEISLGQAWQQGIHILLEDFLGTEDTVIIDGNKIPKQLKNNEQIKAVIEADAKVPQVSLASIIAKQYRDYLMDHKYDKKYPNYQFSKNKGYHSEHHKSAIVEFGFCDIHRMSYNYKFVKDITTISLEQMAKNPGIATRTARIHGSVNLVNDDGSCFGTLYIPSGEHPELEK